MEEVREVEQMVTGREFPDQAERSLAYRIRSSREREAPHLSLGLTREEFSNIQHSLAGRDSKFVMAVPALSDCGVAATSRSPDPLGPTRSLFPAAAPEELGYVSDVCDYSVGREYREQESSSPAVLLGKLSLSLAGEREQLATVHQSASAVAQQQDSPDSQHDSPAPLTASLLVKPCPVRGQEVQRGRGSEDERGVSRQSSVEENSRSEAGSRRKSSGGKSSAIKAKIQMRKMMKEANRKEVPVSGVLSDPDQEDSVEEKQDIEPMLDSEARPGKQRPASSQQQQQLTPETARRMADWNSRFSNLKQSFDPASDRESASPRPEEERGRARARGAGGTVRSKSAHSNLAGRLESSSHPGPVSPRPDYPQSKDDKNKNNTLLAAKRASSMTESHNIPKERSPAVRRMAEDTDDEYLQYLSSVDRYRQANPNPRPFRPVTARTDAIANPLRKMSDSAAARASQHPGLTSAKSKQTTPVREGSADPVRISRSVPKEVIRTTKLPGQTLKEESQAEILGLVKTNKETGQVEKTNDMDYEDYMNIINRVRKTKEHTRVRTEQARLASMYAQEIKRQEEIQQEEERLQLERQKFDEEKRTGSRLGLLVPGPAPPRPDPVLEKGQLDNIQQEQKKVSPTSSLAASPARPARQPSPPGPPSPAQSKQKESPLQAEVLERQQQQEAAEQEERRILESMRNEQTLYIQQQKMREEQVLAEQKKLERLREEQVKQEKDREEIRRLEIERLKQIQEDQERLEEERRIQEEQIRMEQLRLEEERRKQEELQRERQAQYLKQTEEMEAKTKAMEEQKRLETERLKQEQINRQMSMSPREKMIQDKMRHQEKMREEQLKEEAQIRQEKLNLIRQEEMLLVRQDEMLRQIQEEKAKLLKQEEMIRCRQQDRLQQVRSEKALLEKQEQMLKLREEQLIQEHKRQERLREEALILKRQEEEIRRRQQEIAAELLASEATVEAEEVMVCQAREGQVFIGRKPPPAHSLHYPETVLDSNVVHVQQLGTSDWSSSEAASPTRGQAEPQLGIRHSLSTASARSGASGAYLGANENYDSASPFVTVTDQVEIIECEEGEEDWSGSSEEEDTMEEELYDCKVEVKQTETAVPTSVRTIESVVDVPGWAPITPYLNMKPAVTSAEEISAIFCEAQQNLQFVTAGVITSPESVLTTTNMVTTPESCSMQSQLSYSEDQQLSSWPGSPQPPLPPHPAQPEQFLMREQFQTVQPAVPPRDHSFAVTAVYSGTGDSLAESRVGQQNRRSLVELEPPRILPGQPGDPQLSPRLGGPGSAFKPYASSENLFDPGLFPTQKPPLSNGGTGAQPNNGGGDRGSKRFSTSSLKPPNISESDEDFFKPKPSPRVARKVVTTTTDTEPEMREFNLGPIGGPEKKSKKFQKAIYSTSETEEEYQNYLKLKPKWHGKGGHKDSWDPLQIASPPQIVQRPVGLVQKPRPQAQLAAPPARGAVEPGLAPPADTQRIQKSDSIIEVRPRDQAGLLAATERIMKSNSVVEVVPARKLSYQPPLLLEEPGPASVIVPVPGPVPLAAQAPPQKEASPYLVHTKEASPYLSVRQEASPYLQPSQQTSKELSPFLARSPLAVKEQSKEPSPRPAVQETSLQGVYNCSACRGQCCVVKSTTIDVYVALYFTVLQLQSAHKTPRTRPLPRRPVSSMCQNKHL